MNGKGTMLLKFCSTSLVDVTLMCSPSCLLLSDELVNILFNKAVLSGPTPFAMCLRFYVSSIKRSLHKAFPSCRLQRHLFTIVSRFQLHMELSFVSGAVWPEIYKSNFWLIS